jgi:hypothetical protein
MSLTVLFSALFGKAAVGAVAKGVAGKAAASAAAKGLAGKAAAGGIAKSAAGHQAHHTVGAKLVAKVADGVRDQAIEKIAGRAVDSVWGKKKERE